MLKDNVEESEQCFQPVMTVEELQARDFNKYKHFVNEVISNVKDIKHKQVEQKAESGSQDESVEFYDFENLVNLKTYQESLPNLLKKLSEIFENEEIKKLCGESDDNENNEADNDNENEKSSP